MRKKSTETEQFERTDEQLYDETLEMLRNTFKIKQHDYGASYHKAYKACKMKAFITHLIEKGERIVTLDANGEKNQVPNEHLDDSLLDLANFCILTCIERQKERS